MQFCAVQKSKLGKLYFCYAFVLSECTPTDDFFFLSFVNTIELDIDSYLQLVPIKTLQSLHAKLRIITNSFETNLDCTRSTTCTR